MKQKPSKPRPPVHWVMRPDGTEVPYLTIHTQANREDRRRGDRAIATMGRSLAYKKQHPKQYKHAKKHHARARRHEIRVRAYIERLMRAAESVVKAA